ncbi:MAG: prolyl oligopeptidase family serine peptidase [Bacteroidetes bacterium]|jgi:dipeptidyl-peptidase-4|nr:prolyl oligopeptidase family serine peptidase [Bacteroidota bacterium]
MVKLYPHLIFFLIGIFIIPVECHLQNLLSNDIIWASGQLRQESPGNFSFLSDGRHYTKLNNQSLDVYDIETGEKVRSVFTRRDIDSSGYDGPDFDGYEFGPNENIVLLSVDKERIYRYSRKAYYYVYHIETSALQALDSSGKQLYPTLNADGTKVAYVKDNNLYCKDINTDEIIPITKNGKWNEIICGAADWVYEEELKLTRAFEWSPDGRYLAYLEFDESEVEQFSMKYYTDGPYPQKYEFKYPKVGEENATVSAYVVNMGNLKKEKIEHPGGWSDYYVPRIHWIPGSNELLLYYLNRLQNHLLLSAYQAGSWDSRTLLEEKNPFYISIHDNLQFLPNRNQFIWSTERRGWNQLELYNYDGSFVRSLTAPSFDVTDCYGYDAESDRLYYQAALPDPMQRQVFSVDLSGSVLDTILNESGWNSATFSSDFSYYIARNATINTPPKYTLRKADGNVSLRTLVDNVRLSELQDTYDCQSINFITIPVADTVLLNGYILYPQDFDSSQVYPLLMHVYGGPNSQQVVDNWKGSYYWWFQMLAQKGYIVASVDNRGTGARGEAFRKMTYKELGNIESTDQIESAEHFADKNYVDADNVSIFGWSYGGYLSSLALLKGNDVFSSAIAVAPVTNWKWYDSIYTERYMQTYDLNEKGYDRNAPIFYADQLEGRYLLVHGLADDNVHFQHSAEMANALIRANKQFDTYFYPNRNHGIYGSNARRHLFNKITNFLQNR